MRFLLGCLCLFPLISACSTQQEWLLRKRHYPDWEMRPRQVNQYSFAWQQQGEASILPLQVFSTQDEIWLHFSPDQTIPSVFGVDSQGEEILRVHQNPPYQVIKGHYAKLILRWQNKEAILWHRPK